MEKTNNVKNVINSVLKGKTDREINTWMKGTSDPNGEVEIIKDSIGDLITMGLVEPEQAIELFEKLDTAVKVKVEVDMYAQLMKFTKGELANWIMESIPTDEITTVIKTKIGEVD